jgi:hypothetical protein
MNYDKQHIQALVNAILPALKPAFREERRKAKRKGFELLVAGVYTTKTGKPIIPDNDYNITETINVPVDHQAKIERIIRKAGNRDECDTMLARYLANNAKSREAITSNK